MFLKKKKSVLKKVPFETRTKQDWFTHGSLIFQRTIWIQANWRGLCVCVLWVFTSDTRRVSLRGYTFHSTTKRVVTKLTRGGSHNGLAIYMKKYLKAKEELWKFKWFHHTKNTIFEERKKKSSQKKTPKSFKIS